MRVGKVKGSIVVAVFAMVCAGACLLAAAAEGQTKASEENSSPKPRHKPPLQDVTRVSTDQAVRSAAQRASGRPGEGNASDGSTSPEVLEFQPVAGTGDSTQGRAPARSPSKKLRLKDLHGRAQGSLSPAGSRTPSVGAAVGATSKSGKTSVYVETERSQPTSPN